MNVKEFEKLKVEDLYAVTKNLQIGDYFLTEALESQKSTKKSGDSVSVYMVTDITSQGYIVYTPQYLVLE